MQRRKGFTLIELLVEEMGGWFNIRVRCGVQGDIK